MLYVVGIVLIEHNNIYIRQVINRIVGVLQTEKVIFHPKIRPYSPKIVIPRRLSNFTFFSHCKIKKNISAFPR